MKEFAIFPSLNKWNLHTPDHAVVECSTFSQAVQVAELYRKGANLWWWTEWFTYKPIAGRVRYVRNAIVRPARN